MKKPLVILLAGLIILAFGAGIVLAESPLKSSASYAVPWDVVAGHDAKAALAEKAVTVRCIQRADGTLPDDENEPDLVAFCARSY